MVLTDKLKRAATLSVASLLFVASLVPLLTQQTASAATYAYTPLGSRQIKMSESAGGATSVNYNVRFRPATAGALGSVVVQFCLNSPILGDTTCETIPGFSLTGATVSNQSAGVDDPNTDSDLPNLGTDPAPPVIPTANISTLATVTIKALDTDNAGVAVGTQDNTFILSNASAATITNIGDEVAFTINGVHNPTASNASFYARIYTFADDSTTTAGAGNGFQTTDPDHGGTASTNAGGIAMSTAQSITITSKVQEKLTFCVYVDAVATPGSPPTNNCQSKAGTSLRLGDANGVLSSSEEYVDRTAYFGITTNAAGSAVVRMKGDTLKSGSNSIAAVGGSAAASAFGTEQFGMCINEITGSTGLTAATLYGGGGACSSATQKSDADLSGNSGTATFGFDTNNTTGTTSPYGMPIATKPAGAFSTANFAFVGNITDTTKPGIYTTTLSFIATGTY